MSRFTIPVNDSGIKEVPLVLAAPAAALIVKAFGYHNVKVITSDQVTDHSPITGQPIFMPLQLDPVTYLDDMGSKVSLSGMYMPLVLCEFHLHKHIKRTIPSGRRKRGGVNELTNPGAWDVNIKGCFLSGMPSKMPIIPVDGAAADGAFPADALKLFAQYAACTEAVGVTHDLFKYLGIEYIAIEEVDIKPKAGFQNMLFFEIKAFEDTAPSIQLNLDKQ